MQISLARLILIICIIVVTWVTWHAYKDPYSTLPVQNLPLFSSSDDDDDKDDDPPSNGHIAEIGPLAAPIFGGPFGIADNGLFAKVSSRFPADPPEKNYGENHYPVPQRLSLKVREHEGIGYRFGYSTLEGIFSPDYVPGHFLPMVDIRGHHLDNNTWAANAGFIGRYIPETGCAIFGFNVYYDWRRGCMGHYQQVGGGLEILGKRWDFRVNGYFPFGARQHRSICEFDFPGGFFAKFRRREITFVAADAQLGALAIQSRNFLLWAAAGPYYLHGHEYKSSWGVQTRLRPQFRDYMAVDVSYSYDSIFENVFQVQVIFNIPIYEIFKGNKRRQPCLSDRIIYQRVERFEIMPLKNRSHFTKNF